MDDDGFWDSRYGIIDIGMWELIGCFEKKKARNIRPPLRHAGGAGFLVSCLIDYQPVCCPALLVYLHWGYIVLFSGVDLTQAEILLRSWDLPTPVCDLGLRQVVVVVATCCFDFL